MPWPTPLEYQEAVQSPRLSFRDPALRGGQPALNNLGLPKVASGNFACVFKLQASAESFAVRCFVRQVTDQQRRYNLLSQHLASFWLPTLVGFEYLVDGIQVRGQWFPVVKMEWVEGETLENFVQRHLNDSNMLRSLAAQWRGLVAGLVGAHMAHGDLQHGNVLVDQSGFMRLVDYDAMFIPSLLGEKSPELGYPDYQHPQRSEDNYDENLDNFAALVIYLSLLAIAAELSLWGDFHTGDNLILTRADYLHPAQSSCLKRLEGNRDPAVTKLAAYLEDFSSRPLEQIPDLETVLQDAQVAPMPGRQPLAKPSRSKALVRRSTTKKKVAPTPKPAAALKCPSCGQLNEVDRLYCKNCAAILQPKQCKVCGATIPGNAQFCRECSAKQ